jgi:uncharacterized protein
MKEKIETLQELFEQEEKYILLFSGGFDSSAVLGAAIHAGIDVLPVWVDNGMNRATEDEISEQARNLGTERLKILDIEPGKQVCSNPSNRCYFCKSELLEMTGSPGHMTLDGTTADDLGKYRPGSVALDEHGVQSFLAKAGLDHQDAIVIARHFGADDHLAGIESCLATRLKYGLGITHERLAAIRDLERYVISKTGDYDVRCRLDDEEHLRVELKKENSFGKLASPEFREKLVEKGGGIAMFITVDMKGSRPNEYDKKIKQ